MKTMMPEADTTSRSHLPGSLLCGTVLVVPIFSIDTGEGVIQMTNFRTRVTAALFALAPVAVVIATAAPRVRI